MIRLLVKKSNLQSTLNLIKSGLRVRGKKALTITCEITITDNKITIAVPGAVFSVNCHVKGSAKITLPFFYFFDIIKKTNHQEIEIEIDERQMTIGTTTVGVQTTFIEDDKILRTIDLPLNYSDKDLILLKTGKYTKEELSFNNLTTNIELAEIKLEKNIEKAYDLLKQYGISKSELVALVNERLFKSKK